MSSASLINDTKVYRGPSTTITKCYETQMILLLGEFTKNPLDWVLWSSKHRQMQKYMFHSMFCQTVLYL